MKTSFASGDVVKYECQVGYVGIGGNRYRSCKNGQWTEQYLKCKREIQHGYFTYTGSVFGDTATAVCDDGYRLVGRATRNCLNGGWDGRTPTCEAVECEEPPATNADKVDIRDFYTYKAVVRYRCRLGTLVGQQSIWCTKDGTWSSPPPKCQVGETTCPHPAVADSVQSGREVPAYRVGGRVTITCRQGFQLNGAQQVICGSDGQWQPQPPQCLPLPEDRTEQPSINERPSNREQPHINDRPTTTEQPHITEQLSTTEQPPLKDGRCRPPQPASGSNARLTDQYIMKTSFASGDVVKYECQVGYVGIGGNRYRSCKNGQWTEQYLKCKREIQHGYFTYTGSVFGDTATAVCDDGYRLVGHATRNCLNGGWDGRIPTCEAVECNDPPATNAEMLDIRDFYTYKAVVRYRCHGGILVGRKDIWCTKDGTWSSPPPKCQVMTCPIPSVAHAYWTAPRSNQYQYKEAVSIACNPGFTMTGPNLITCDKDGQWSPKLPICRRTYNYNNWNRW
ncbi:hypothetical protein INR49_017130 [Caranx melampygus]|nr:hypothetical protein INR49_017130 [Caranx melampygus]